MIPAPPGIVARYYHGLGTGRPEYTHKPVVAFDGDGRPYVVPDEGKRLIPADQESDYVGMVEDPRLGIVALIPGGGWRSESTDDDGTTWTEPLTGWGVRANGSVVPLETDDLGFVEQPSKVYHPDEINEQAADLKAAP